MIPAISGQRYGEQVPDTLDLSERAALALNGLGGSIDPDLMTMYGLIHFCQDRPFFSHWASAETLVDPKFGESFPLMRIMCGCDLYADLEEKFREALVYRIDGGLYWDRYTPKRPWRNFYAPSFYPEGKAEDFATLPGTGRMLRALISWQELGGGLAYEMLIRELISGLRQVAIDKGDYCYYPQKGGWGEPGAYPRSGWLNTDESTCEVEGGEGSVLAIHGHQIYGASQWYARSGDPKALDLAAKLANYCMLPRFWGGVPDIHGDRTGLAGHIAPVGPEPMFTSGSDNGHWYSHFHARAIALRGLLEYGRAAGQERALEFVQRAYEFTLGQGIARTGWVNCYPGALNREEGCALADLVALGIRLSDAGLGDYWDNVDAVLRNQLAEIQLTQADRIKAYVQRFAGRQSELEGKAFQGQLCYDNIISRCIGVFGSLSTPTSLDPLWVMHCCTGNATQGLYYGWEGIVREDEGVAKVNLLLNRAAKLVDVDSYLPYEGKVIIHNKLARQIAIRMPAWVDRSNLVIQVGGADRPRNFIGNYLTVDDVKPGENTVLLFPVKETVNKYTVNAHSPIEQTFTCTFRGSTLVDIAPRDDKPESYPLYLRDHLKSAGLAPLKYVQRFVAERTVRNW
jgi:hypothetical protein